jgi:phosphotransferase system enzyme I (PtsP)
VNVVTGGPRILLRRLREIMASALSVEQRLDQVVRLIAANMVAEVCSIYVARGGEILELFATEGLKKEAVHQTRLRYREGLVGEIAATGLPLNLSDAQSHPKFVYRPETGEEIYHSLMGVPILRGGRVVGVLVVQNRTRRHYTEEELEALQTVAMVVAEFIATSLLVDTEEVAAATLERAATPSFEVTPFAEGVAIGRAVFHEPIVQVEAHLAQDPDLERRRLDEAFVALNAQLDAMMDAQDMKAGEHRDIFEVYRLLANDPGWRQRILSGIDSGLTAEAAVERTLVENRARLSRTADPYLRERMSDLDDLAYRLIRHLTGAAGTAADADLPDDAVVIARAMGPAELLEYDRAKLRAVILRDGSATAHVTIIARALGIPLVGNAGDVIERINPGEQIVVDGEGGWIYISPAPEVVQSFQETIAARSAKAAAYAALKDEPAITADGVEVDLFINAGLALDMAHLDTTGAKGVGLFRTEFQFMVSAQMPRLETQIEFYRQILDAAQGRPVVFRTLDIGGDKPVPFMARDHEENPAMGWRAIRVAVDRPALLRYQLRALLEAVGEGELSLMFPMVTEVPEYVTARSILERELTRRKNLGRPLPRSLKVGCMLEVPALVWQLDRLLPMVDFMSLGSNDLMQFFFAADRNNPKMASRYDILSPPALAFLRHIVTTIGRHSKPLTVCGEMGGKTVEAMALIGLGLRRLSVSPASVGPIKMMIRSLRLGDLQSYLQEIMPMTDHSLRSRLADFARDHGVVV